MPCSEVRYGSAATSLVLLMNRVHPLLQGLLLEAGQHDRAQLLPVLGQEHGRLLEARVFEDVAQADVVDHGHKEALHGVRHLYPLAVLGAHRYVGQRGVAAQPRVLREHVRESHHHLPEDQVNELVEVHCLHEAGLHLLPLAGLVAHVERGDYAAHGAHVGGVGCGLHRGVVRPRPVGLPGEDHHPADLGCDGSLVGLVVGIGALGSPAGQRAVDQVGALGAERLVVDAHAGRCARREALDDHVRLKRQPSRLLLVFRVVEVQHHAPLAAVPLLGRGDAPGPVSSGRLHLDHVGPEVRQHHGGHRSQHPFGEVHDLESFEYLRHRFLLSSAVVGARLWNTSPFDRLSFDGRHYITTGRPLCIIP